MKDLRQAKLAQILLQDPDKSLPAAMIEAGYSESYANSPTQLTESKSFRKILDSIIDNQGVVATLKAILNRREYVTQRYSIETADEVILDRIAKKGGEFPEIVKVYETKTRKVGKGKNAAIEEFEVECKEVGYYLPDVNAFDKMIDKLAKLRGDYAPEKKHHTGNINVSKLLDEAQNDDATHKPGDSNGEYISE